MKMIMTTVLSHCRKAARVHSVHFTCTGNHFKVAVKEITLMELLRVKKDSQ